MTHFLNLLLARGAAVVLLWFTSIAGAAAEPDKISLAYCTDCVPFHFQDKDGRPAGMIIDLWRLWSEKTGIDIDFRTAPWEETLRMVGEGEADAHAGLFFSDERARFLEKFERFPLDERQPVTWSEAANGVPVPAKPTRSNVKAIVVCNFITRESPT